METIPEDIKAKAYAELTDAVKNAPREEQEIFARLILREAAIHKAHEHFYEQVGASNIYCIDAGWQTDLMSECTDRIVICTSYDQAKKTLNGTLGAMVLVKASSGVSLSNIHGWLDKSLGQFSVFFEQITSTD